MVSAPLRGKSSRLHSQYNSMVATDAAAMTATTGDANAEVSDVATLEKMSAGVAAQKAVRLNCKRASPLPITPLWASTNPMPMTTKIIANPVNTSSNSQEPFAVLQKCAVRILSHHPDFLKNTGTITKLYRITCAARKLLPDCRPLMARWRA